MPMVLGCDLKQEWDGAFKVDDVLYLCEAKHVMTLDKVLKIPDRIKKFWELQPYAQSEFRNIKNVVGVACGTYIPEMVRQEAHKAGLICVLQKILKLLIKFIGYIRIYNKINLNAVFLLSSCNPRNRRR
jgi:hypothetical protein